MTFIALLLTMANLIVLGMGYQRIKTIQKMIEDNTQDHGL